MRKLRSDGLFLDFGDVLGRALQNVLVVLVIELNGCVETEYINLFMSKRDLNG